MSELLLKKLEEFEKKVENILKTQERKIDLYNKLWKDYLVEQVPYRIDIATVRKEILGRQEPLSP